MARQLNSEVKVKLIMLVENLKASFEDMINDSLENGFRCGSITGDSPKKIFRLACALDLIKKEEYDVLYFLVDRRNEAAHNKTVDLNYDDFPSLHKLLSEEKVKKLENRNDTYWGHYLAVLDAIQDFFNQRAT